MNILILGGSKFIGWRLVELLGSTNHQVTVLNRGNFPRDYPKNVTHISCDRHDVPKLLEKIGSSEFDVVYDMCAFTANDIQPILTLFKKIPQKYIFISTAAVYLEPQELPLTEDSPQGIHEVWGEYGGAKLDCEKLLLNAYKEIGFPSVIVRPSYVYGIGNTIDRETFLFDRIEKQRKILIPGDGEAVIQLGEVTDLCRALLAIAENPLGIGSCYNISGSELITINGLVALIANIMGQECETENVSPESYGMTDRDVFPFDNKTYFTSSKKFTDEFSWTPSMNLRQGLTQAYEHWKSSKDRISTKYEKEDFVLGKLNAPDPSDA